MSGSYIGWWESCSGVCSDVCYLAYYLWDLRPEGDLKRGMYDRLGAKKYKKDQTALDEYITDLQADMETLGFEEIGAPDGGFGGMTEQAVKAFQEAAKTNERMTPTGPMSISVTYGGRVDGIVNADVKQELRIWIEKGYKVYGPYGGYLLRKGDTDATKLWGGRKRAEKESYVKELQKDLVKLGFWVSHPNHEHGMRCDGIFDDKLKGAVITFQKEFDLKANGTVSRKTAKKIKDSASDTNFRRPGHETPGHGRFYQLPPSAHYNRYTPNYDADHVMTDNWGTRAMIDMLVNAATGWRNRGHAEFLIGDISLYNGGPMAPHHSHRDGNGVDLDSDAFCSINRATFDRVRSLELARLLVAQGATRVLFNCKYVTDNCTQVHALANHHHHMHVDVNPQTTGPHPDQECLFCKQSVYNACGYDGKANRRPNQLTP